MFTQTRVLIFAKFKAFIAATLIRTHRITAEVVTVVCRVMTFVNICRQNQCFHTWHKNRLGPCHMHWVYLGTNVHPRWVQSLHCHSCTHRNQWCYCNAGHSHVWDFDCIHLCLQKYPFITKHVCNDRTLRSYVSLGHINSVYVFILYNYTDAWSIIISKSEAIMTSTLIRAKSVEAVLVTGMSIIFTFINICMDR